MSKHEGLSRVAKALRGLGVVWMLFCTVGAVVFAWGREARPLTRDEQIALYEKQVGHSITEEIAKVQEKRDKQNLSPEPWNHYWGPPLVPEAETTKILFAHFGDEVPRVRDHDWTAAGLLIACGLVGLGVGWGLGWIVAGFAS